MDRMMGLDFQTLVQYVIQLINTGILALILGFILYAPVLAFLNARKERIAKNISDADEALKSARQNQEWYEEKMKAIDFERNEILETARQRGLDMESRIIAEAKEEAKRIKDRAMLDVKREQENSLDEMKKQIVEISTMVAQKYIEEKIDENTQNRLLEEVISDLGDATWLN